MNLADYMERSASQFPDRIAVRHESEIIVYGELNTRCNQLAAGLKQRGLSAGDRCALMMPNSIQTITVYNAIAKLGAVVIPINFLYREHELTHIFADAKPKAFIGAAPYLDEIRPVLDATADTPIRLALDAPADDQFSDLQSAYTDDTDFSTYAADDNDTLNILYTSGTTGVPKGVMLTHGNLASEARILAEMREKLGPEAVVIGVLPLYHIYGITSVLNVSMYLGLTIELFTQFEPEKVIAVAEREAQTILFAVPTMYNRLIQIAAERPPQNPSLKFCVSGGSSLPVEFLHRFESMFNTKIYEGYGLTEAPVCVENPYGGLTKPGSIGLPIPEFNAKIIDPDGTELGPDLSTKANFYTNLVNKSASDYPTWEKLSDCNSVYFITPGSANGSSLAAALIQSISDTFPMDHSCTTTAYNVHDVNNQAISDNELKNALITWINNGAQNN